MTDRFWGRQTIYGVDGEHDTPYLTRLWIGRLRLHIFHRPDNDPDCHDHPWNFWTFPLTPYVEEVVETLSTGERFRSVQTVPAFRVSYRTAEHCHRVLGRRVLPELSLPIFDPKRTLVTIVWRGASRRRWGFLKTRDGKWCWIGWKDYVFGGGKHAPCEPGEGGK